MHYDLHTHTTASDGSCTPAQLVRLAKGLGLKGIAVTDHDTVGGVADAAAAGREQGLDVIPAIELSTDWQAEEVHVLGYFIDIGNNRLLRQLEELEEERRLRAEKMLGKLADLGLKISWKQVRAKAKGTLGRAHVARVLVEEGLVPNIGTAFHLYLSKGKPAYVPREKLSPRQAVRLIKDCGGVPVIAHPGLLRDPAVLAEIVTWGFQGIEAYYPEHSPRQLRQFLQIAACRKLAVSGGSDFHGPDRETNPLGASTISIAQLRQLTMKREE